MIRKRYRIVDIQTDTSTISPSPEHYSKSEAICQARILMALDDMLGNSNRIVIVQKKVKHGWMRVWPDKGPVVTEVELKNG